MASNAQDNHAPLRAQDGKKDEDDEEDCKNTHTRIPRRENTNQLTQHNTTQHNTTRAARTFGILLTSPDLGGAGPLVYTPLC